MNYAKIFGWVLLIVGLIIIGWTLFSSYNVFTGKTEPPAVFELPPPPAEIIPLKEKTGIQDIQAQLQKMINEQLGSILPISALNRILNLFIWSMLAWFLVFAGSQISSLGIKLIKK